MKRIVATVDLKSLKTNIEETTKKVPQNIKRVAVIKADAYGHGAVPAALYLQKNGIEAFAVATFEEAVELRENGVTKSILVLGYIEPEDAKKAEELHITVSVGSVDYAQKLFSFGKPDAHLQVDTGMCRMGVYCHNENDIAHAVEDVKKIVKFSEGKIKGIYTHFVMSDVPDSDMTDLQYNAFTSLISKCEAEGIVFEEKHCCNSLGAINYPQYALDAVRIGISLYGYDSNAVTFTPSMTLKTKIIKIFEGKKGDTVSYCGTYTLTEDKKIAVCGAGYADGLPRGLSNKGYYLVNGKKANILGRICMDLSMIDVTDIDCNVGDEAVIFGPSLPVSDLANMCGTISHEILCAVSKRVPREYVE